MTSDSKKAILIYIKNKKERDKEMGFSTYLNSKRGEIKQLVAELKKKYQMIMKNIQLSEFSILVLRIYLIF